VRFNDIRPVTKVGREYQHLEDLVFLEGSIGARFATHVLKNIAEDASNVMVKWDGMPTVYWGRNPAGEFVLVNKNGWGRTECTTPEMLESFIFSTGKDQEWRKEFAESFTEMWPILEQATPKDFRGYFFGDLLFFPYRPVTSVNETLEFAPNKVTYKVKKDSAIGQKIAEAKIGVAVHKMFDTFGGPALHQEVQVFESTDVLMIPQTRVGAAVQVNQDKIEHLNKILEGPNGATIDRFITPFKGLSDMSNIIYTYVNQMSKANRLSELEEGFYDWLAESKVSKPKQERILNHMKESPVALPMIFFFVNEIMSLKDEIIEQLDTADTDIQSATLNEAGGEGYILLDEKVKLVARHRWKPY